MRRKWFVPASADDPYDPFGMGGHAATLYSSQDGFTLPISTGPTDSQARAAANRAIWEATPAPAKPGLLARLLHRATK
ncbi:hypothetical protein [Micromonospora eburnea]|uniref:Uncharacterized protein n=1 Tax=Micromonospora eburnea TaxID=227316 RepID=A0A1C6UX86_9ACTN|nr:hypothetical protein [Micromonospora eburnea]SCL58631.1 hypothetical protein GA0070604_3878 [Micromonospora eburnea]